MGEDLRHGILKLSDVSEEDVRFEVPCNIRLFHGDDLRTELMN